MMEGNNTVVRRLTPVEAERLQGFPDNYTNIPWANKPTAPDSRRYKALGNSMAVPVMRWIGKRMMEVKTVVCDEDAIDSILYVTPSDDGQLSLF
jgi:site-specific DNA-cytosine methylase